MSKRREREREKKKSETRKRLSRLKHPPSPCDLSRCPNPSPTPALTFLNPSRRPIKHRRTRRSGLPDACRQVFFFVPPLDRVIEKRKEISRSRRLVVPFLLFSRVAARRSSLDKALVKKKPDLGAAEAGKMGGEEEILARGSFFFSTSRLTQVPVVFLPGFLNLNRFQNKKTLKTQTQQPTSPPAWSSSASTRTRGSSCPPQEEQQARRATTTTTITSSSRTR